MKRRLSIACVGLAASVSWLASAAMGDETAAKANPDSIKILSCNIRLPQPADEQAGDGWEARKDLCANVIEAQHADVICLQECSYPQFKDLKSRLTGFESFGLSNPDILRPVNTIFFLKSRYELMSAGGFWLSETPHVAGTKSWDSARSRLANWVHLKDRKSGRELRVWNTHLDHLGQVAREKQARMIIEASDVFPKDLPQLLTGDFNAAANNPAIRSLRAAGWLDTFSAVHGEKEPGPTYHGFLGPKHAEKKPNGKKIDWIFCRGAAKPLSAAVIRDGRDGRYPSDHYFVSAEVVLDDTSSSPTASAPSQ